MTDDQMDGLRAEFEDSPTSEILDSIDEMQEEIDSAIDDLFHDDDDTLGDRKRTPSAVKLSWVAAFMDCRTALNMELERRDNQ